MREMNSKFIWSLKKTHWFYVEVFNTHIFTMVRFELNMHLNNDNVYMVYFVTMKCKATVLAPLNFFCQLNRLHLHSDKSISVLTPRSCTFGSGLGLLGTRYLNKEKWHFEINKRPVTCFIENRITISRLTRHFEPISGCQFRQHTSGMLAAHFGSCLFDVRHRVQNVSELYLFNMGNQWRYDYVL